MNKKQRFLNYLSGDHTGWVGYAFDGCPFPYPMVVDPITLMETSHDTDYYVDCWGASWRHKPDDAGAIPLVSSETAVIHDIENWEEELKLPDLNDLDFETTHGILAAVDRDETPVIFPHYYGPFERLHTLMPFEETLMAMYEEPEDFSAAIGAITDWKIRALGLVIDEFHPDIIHAHDDWGDASSLFAAPDIFREVLKPHYKRLYGFIKSKGVLVQHHNDGIGFGLEEDMVDMGIDMWQGVQSYDRIRDMKENTKGKLVYLGGLNQFLIDSCGGNEEVIRAEVRRCIDENAPGGSFLPCYPSVMPVDMNAMSIAVDEMNRYGQIWLEKNA